MLPKPSLRPQSCPSVHMPRKKTMRLLTTLLFCALSVGAYSNAYAKPSPSDTKAAAQNQNTVSSLDISKEDGKTVLRIKGNQTPAFSVFKLGNPLRLFVDISNSQLADKALQKQVHDGLITQVGLLQYENDAQAVTRAIIGFNKESVTQYDVTTDGNDVVIVVSGQQSKSAVAKNKKRSSQTQAEQQKIDQQLAKRESEIAHLQKELDSTNLERQKERDRLASLQALTAKQEMRLKELEGLLAESKKLDTEKVSTRAIQPQNTIRGLDIVSVNGRSQIIIDLDRPGAFKTTTSKSGRAIMILNDVELPKNLQKKLASDTSGGTVRFVQAIAGKNNETRLEAKLDKKASELVRQSGKRLIWEFAPSVFEQHQQAPQLASKTTKREQQNWSQTRPNVGESYTSAPPSQNLIVTNPSEITSIPGLPRKPVTIDLRGSDIQNVLRLIAHLGNINIVSSEEVKGNITLKLSGVPLDEVILTVLQAQGLGFEKRGKIFRVAPQKVLIEEQKARVEAAKAAQEVRPLEVFLLPVRYATAKNMTQQIESLITKRGSVSVDERTNTLVIKDVADNLNAIKQLVDSLDSEVPQVLIEARIVETSDTFAREVGIQWGGDASFSQTNGNPTGLLFPSVLGVAGGASGGTAPPGVSSNPNFAVNLPAAAGLGSGGALGLTLGSIGGALNLNLRLSALEETGHAKIVSAPSIMAMDNQTASISQGTSIPISVVSAAGVQTTFVNADLDLTVTPSVTPDGNIRLKINATKNEPDFQNTGASGDPSIISRSASTELMIRDGDTTVIGGIYTSNTGSSSSGIPFLKDIPILGYFFRSTSTSNRRSELLIFITPRIVNRAQSIGTFEGQNRAKDNNQAL